MVNVEQATKPGVTYAHRRTKMTGMPDIKQARARRGHTQEQAAREIGVTIPTLSRWENGHRVPRGLSVKAILRYVAAK